MGTLVMTPPSFLVFFFRARQIWEDVIITHPTGSGKACPEAMEQESRECVEDCPADPLVLEADEKAAKEGGDGEKKEATEGGGGEPAVELVVREEESSIQETYCSIEQEVWTVCSVDCLQERFLDDTCGKEAEVRLKVVYTFLGMLLLLLLLLLSLLACCCRCCCCCGCCLPISPTYL